MMKRYYMFMSNNKGFTLVEIIISILLILLFSVVFLSSITSYHRWLVSTKTDITQEAFSSQALLEEQIYNIKAELQQLDPGDEIDENSYSSLNITEKLENIELFSDQFSGFGNRVLPVVYQAEVMVGSNRSFVTLVGEARLPELPVPVIVFTSLKLNRNGTLSDIAGDNYEYYHYANLALRGQSTLTSNPQNSFYRNKHEWYVSEPGFLLPTPPGQYIGEDDLGTLYPAFPSNFNPVPISNLPLDALFTSNLTNSIVNQYPGRHIIYTVTPYAKSLKKGVTVWGNPAYIMGPPYTEGLIAHYDASSIFVDHSGQEPGTLYRIQKWPNLRPSTESPKEEYDLVQNYEADRPVFRTSDFGPFIPFQEGDDGGASKVWGKALGNIDNGVASMSNTSISLNSTNGFTLFMVLRMADLPLPTSTDNFTIIKGSSVMDKKEWELKRVSGENNSPLLSFSTNCPRNEELPESAIMDSALEVGKWYLVQITAYPSNMSSSGDVNEPSQIALKVYYLHHTNESPLVGEVTGNYFDINTYGIELHWNDIDIAEIMIFDKGNIDEFNLNPLILMINGKYNPS